MNYRHAFHAGNFADVLKHAVLARIVMHLVRKERPFRFIDAHAGVGLYDLGGSEAARTGEWRDGIGRLLAASPSPVLAAFLDPYLGVVGGLRQGAGGALPYPGSPEIVRRLSRPQDRLLLCELHPDDAAALTAQVAHDRRAKVLAIDGWLALKAYVPPPERRGLVLANPPFEQPGDYRRLVAGLAAAHRRWSTGCYALWYPIKDVREHAAFLAALREAAIPDTLVVELRVRAATAVPTLHGCGLVLVNAPWELPAQLAAALPELAAILAQGPGAAADVMRVTQEA